MPRASTLHVAARWCIFHGIADNRTSGAGIVQRFGGRGFDVVAYDSRAHGESDGDVCACGFFEKHDLHRVLDGVAPGPIVLMGTSLGAAVALSGGRAGCAGHGGRRGGNILRPACGRHRAGAFPSYIRRHRERLPDRRTAGWLSGRRSQSRGGRCSDQDSRAAHPRIGGLGHAARAFRDALLAALAGPKRLISSQAPATTNLFAVRSGARWSVGSTELFQAPPLRGPAGTYDFAIGRFTCRSQISAAEWTLNREASALSPVVAPVVRGGFVKIEHREPTVSVHLSINMDGKPFDARFERSSEWDGEALVFADRIPTLTGEMTIVFRYELLEGGRRLRAAEQLRAPDREQDNVWVFDRAG